MADAIERYLRADDAELDVQWTVLGNRIRGRFGRDVTVEALLFLIGIQSRGRGYEPELEKEDKQDAIMEGTFCAFETLGLYRRVGLDPDGSWIWELAVDRIPQLPVEQQEKLLKLGIVRYFDSALSSPEDSV